MSEEKKGIADAENSTTTETMADYARELEASFRTIREGDVISGTVIDVRETGVTLDLGYYAPAVIKTEDLSKDPSFSVLADIHVGDTLEGTVVKRDDGAGNIQMSCVEAAETLGWDRLKQYQEEKTILKINKNRPFHARNPRKRLRRHPYANESFAFFSTCKSGNVCYLCNGFVSEVTN